MNNKELFNPINNTISEIFNCDKRCENVSDSKKN